MESYALFYKANNFTTTGEIEKRGKNIPVDIWQEEIVDKTDLGEGESVT